MASRRAIIEQEAQRAGIGPAVLYGVWGAESNFGRNKGPSSAGALGDFQFEPATARSLGVQIGNFRSEARGAARYLAQYHSRGRRGMLAAYNAGPAGNPNNPQTRAYIPKVLRLARGFHGRGGSGGGGGGSAGSAGLPGVPGTQGAQNQPLGSTGALALLQALQQPKQAPSSAGLQTPAFAAAPALPKGYQSPVSGGGPAAPPDVNALLDQIRTAGGDVQLAPGAAAIPGVPGVAGVTGGFGSTHGKGRVVLAPGADRPGVRTHGDVLNFARQVSAISGERLRIATGSRHHRLTTRGTVSDHWRGEAADIPATGHNLVRIGRAALIAAGMDPKKAREQTGGGFNVGDWQVIFATDAPGWGDHTTHLHIGRRR